MESRDLGNYKRECDLSRRRRFLEMRGGVVSFLVRDSEQDGVGVKEIQSVAQGA